MAIVTETSSTGLWTTVLKPQVWYYGHCHLGLLPKVAIFQWHDGNRVNKYHFAFIMIRYD